MTDELVFDAIYADWKVLKTRKVVQVIFEIPSEKKYTDRAQEVLDGMPDSAKGVWVAIARMTPPESFSASLKGGHSASPMDDETSRPALAEESRAPNSNPLAQRAAMMGDDPDFWAFVTEVHHPARVNNAMDAAEFIRLHCRVASRAHIRNSEDAIRRFSNLVSHFENWRFRRGYP